MEEIRHVSVADVLSARDERAVRQQAFRQRYAVPLISFTMNIAGSIKNDAQIERAFREGVRSIEVQLAARAWQVLDKVQSIAFTGCEALWAVRADAKELKQAMRLIEEADALGRLFDIDVLDADGCHLSRGEERSCLICGAPVRNCARSRAHTAEALYARTREIIHQHFQDQFAQTIGLLAQKALLYEAVTTPKPGLVDAENSGSHQDMDLFSFLNSACALRSYFEECARLGMRHADVSRLQYAGMMAEDRMMAAAQANTHKGAIFSLGILCYAAGSCGEDAERKAVLQKAAKVGEHFLHQLQTAGQSRTAGEKQYAQYGLTGVRGEAASGFRTVREIALPAFARKMQETNDFHAAGVEALLHLMAHLQDSNLIRRAGLEGQQWAMDQARERIRCGYQPDDLRQMNAQFVSRSLSPGGSADLLAVTYFLFFLERGT